jgi:hypothetical protein
MLIHVAVADEVDVAGVAVCVVFVGVTILAVSNVKIRIR